MHPSLANKIEQKRFETCVKIWFSAEFDADSLFCRFGYDCNFYLQLIPCMATHIQNWLNHWCPLFFSGMILVYPQYILVYPNHKVESNNGCCEPLNQPTEQETSHGVHTLFIDARDPIGGNGAERLRLECCRPGAPTGGEAGFCLDR